jgi:hypothetical protein
MSIEYPIQSDKSKVEKILTQLDNYLLGIKHQQKFRKRSIEYNQKLHELRNITGFVINKKQ